MRTKKIRTLTRSVSFRRLVLGVAAGVLVALGVLTRTTTAFNPQPDPPGFGLVSLFPAQGIRINVVCSGHGVGQLPPGPCSGELMFHDVQGNTINSQRYSLMPGETDSLELGLSGREGRVGIVPCIIPGPDSKRAIPSVEVFSTDSGLTMLFINPAVARLSDLEVGPGKK
jgi:hypothetical protein